MPFGCHAWHNVCADFYIKIFANYGYDLRPFKNQMRNTVPNNWLMLALYQRLNRRINKGQSLTYCLSKNKFASIRVIRSPYTMLILARLLLENNSLSDRIYFYDEKDLNIFIKDLKAEKLPHLLLTGGGTDMSIIEILQRNGLSYGKKFVTFHREYLNHCEKIFNNLSK